MTMLEFRSDDVMRDQWRALLGHPIAQSALLALRTDGPSFFAKRFGDIRDEPLIRLGYILGCVEAYDHFEELGVMPPRPKELPAETYASEPIEPEEE